LVRRRWGAQDLHGRALRDLPQRLQRRPRPARPGGPGGPRGQEGPGHHGRGMRAGARGAGGREADLAHRGARLRARARGAEGAAGAGVGVIEPGGSGVRDAFGYVDPGPLLAGIRLVAPWSSIERYSTREEQWPTHGEQIEAIEALSSEQMGMHVEVSIRWQIDPMQAPKIFTEIGNEDQIRGAVLNAIRKGVRDGMVQYSINDISKRTQIANTMEGLVDSARL